ncbi:MAG: CoA transferase [Actinobacteria bacterium]|nr:CoA transferase [Actinomycetota bacterium]MCA1720248.1 CoA transferase [Actinomycetota bacterium]
MPGPLAGVRVVELAGIGPGPYACMLLADLGADVLRIDRPGGAALRLNGPDLLARGRSTAAVDLKNPSAAELVLRLVEEADVLVEGNRPGVAERLGVGPDVCLERNPRLVYARMTGWGQEGPWAPYVGHDINYAGLTGALAAIGEAGRKPVPPLNLVADFGGGSMFCVTGILAALVERSVSGRGQVVDAAMVDGVTSLMTMFYAMRAGGGFSDERGSNLLDGGAPFYDTYACADGEYVAVGALEPQFWAEVVEVLGLQDAPGQAEVDRWPELRAQLTSTFLTKTRDEWAAVFEGRPACVTPVLHLSEAAGHPHLAARQTTVEVDGVVQPAPAPRFSRTPAVVPQTSEPDTRASLEAWGVDDLDDLAAAGVIG